MRAIQRCAKVCTGGVFFGAAGRLVSLLFVNSIHTSWGILIEGHHMILSGLPTTISAGMLDMRPNTTEGKQGLHCQRHSFFNTLVFVVLSESLDLSMDEPVIPDRSFFKMPVVSKLGFLVGAVFSRVFMTLLCSSVSIFVSGACQLGDRGTVNDS